jgi:hypothetical protein
VTFRHYSGILQPEEVALLQRLFDRFSADLSIKKDTPQADWCAKRLVAVYQSGVRDEELLLATMHKQVHVKEPEKRHDAT